MSAVSTTQRAWAAEHRVRRTTDSLHHGNACAMCNVRDVPQHTPSSDSRRRTTPTPALFDAEEALLAANDWSLRMERAADAAATLRKEDAEMRSVAAEVVPCESRDASTSARAHVAPQRAFHEAGGGCY